jgi:hypothetical protein
MPLSQSQQQKVSSRHDYFSELSSRSSLEGMSLPSPPLREVTAAKPPTQTQDTISSGSSAGSSKTQEDILLSEDPYYFEHSNQRCSVRTGALHSQNIATSVTLRTEQENLNLSETSAMKDLKSSQPLQYPSSYEAAQSSPAIHTAKSVATVNEKQIESTLYKATTVNKNVLTDNGVSNTEARGAVEGHVCANLAPGIGAPATLHGTPSEFHSDMGADRCAKNHEALQAATAAQNEEIGRKRKNTISSDLRPSTSSSAIADGSVCNDLPINLNGLECEQVSEVPEDMLRDEYVSKWEAARRDRAAMNSGLLSQAQETTLEVLLNWPCRAPLELTKLALPHVVVERYRHQRGITGAHTWQVEALRSGEGRCWQHGDHLVYSAPTGGGKTLVAELLMLRRLLQSDSCGTILWAVPLKVARYC